MDAKDSKHETRDVDVRAVARLGAGLAGSLLLVLLLMAWMFYHLASRQVQSAARPGPMVEERQPPPEPRLQVTPARDLETVRAEEESLLNTYGWVNREAGIVRIPIERAMELLAERGLPRAESRGRPGS